MKTLRLPLALFAAPALLVRFAPDRVDWLTLDRTAALHGECWRWWTGHWVHFSFSHLGWNLAVLLAAGAWLELARPGWLLRHTLVAAPLISLGLLAAEPGMAVYGGLSALATSVVTLLALDRLCGARTDRVLGATLLLMVAAKSGHDAFQSFPVFSRFDQSAVRLSRCAHGIGMLAALALWPVWRRLLRGRAAPLKMTPPGPVTDSRRQGSGSYP